MIFSMNVVLIFSLAVVLILQGSDSARDTSLLILNEAYSEKETTQFVTHSWLGLFLNDTGAGRVVPIDLALGQRGGGCADDAVVVNLRSKPDGALYAISSSVLRPGAVTTVRMDYPVSLSAGGDSEVNLLHGQRRYTLRREGVKADLTDARVTLSDGQETQLLFAADGFVDDPHFTLHWAGDMDGDGRLDLIATLSHKYSVFPTRLLLSSLGRQRELLGVAATLERTAC
jgi:hypothetical protein